MRRSPLGTNLLKSDIKKRSKFGGKPEFTDRFLDIIENENKEGVPPPEGDMLIFHYNDRYHHLHSKYTINRNGEIKSLKGKVMKPFFHPNKRGPRVRIQIEKLNKNGESIFLEKEIGILQIMEQKFGIYLPGYKLKRAYPKDYMLVPKDGDYNNMRFDNLHYICRDEQTKKKLIKQYIQSSPNIDNEIIANIFRTSQGYIRKAKQELADEGHLLGFSKYQKFQKEIGIEFNEESQKIYQILIECEGKLSNLEIAKILRPRELSENINQRFFTDKIVRARKRLTDKGLIPRFNEGFESKREEAIRMIQDKANSGKTNKQIADVLGLKKEQIDNLTRQIKKEARK